MTRSRRRTLAPVPAPAPSAAPLEPSAGPESAALPEPAGVHPWAELCALLDAAGWAGPLRGGFWATAEAVARHLDLGALPTEPPAALAVLRDALSAAHPKE